MASRRGDDVARRARQSPVGLKGVRELVRGALRFGSGAFGVAPRAAEERGGGFAVEEAAPLAVRGSDRLGLGLAAGGVALWPGRGAAPDVRFAVGAGAWAALAGWTP
jgi:hypothetical protein